MEISSVIITKDESPRLRLTLEALARQDVASADCEAVVVDDGSSDETPEVLRAAPEGLRLTVVRHERALGRSAARNAGAAAARGRILLFLDGDVIAAPDLARQHLAAHAGRAVMGRGDNHHLRCTRFFLDPSTGSPMPGQEERVARMGDLTPHLVTVEQIRHRFHEIEARAEPSIYPGAGPRRLQELELQALHQLPDASVLWMAASGHNFSVPRAELLAVGGYDPRITINEHRELALRLQQRGLRLVPVPGRSYHLTHRVGWRDPLTDDPEWERVFYAKHPTLATKLMMIFWQSLAADRDIPEAARILSLEQLERIVTRGTEIDYDAIRRAHPRLIELAAP